MDDEDYLKRLINRLSELTNGETNIKLEEEED
jgi:hypothetical protein